MKKYKLIKEYPGSPELETIIIEAADIKNKYFIKRNDIWYINSPENYPEFWEEIRKNETLKEKICYVFGGLKKESADQLEKISEDFAMHFFKWASVYKANDKNNWSLTVEELLEIYKEGQC